MTDWKVKSKKPNTDSLIAKTFTLGLSATEYDYEVQNRETREVRTVTAYDEHDLASKLKKGKFRRN
jgi:hypothetical protein